ncbi:alkaline phosphatase D family protein [Marinomonas polaris]|uniref:alkaline phosphatase D family protein n=1 Tax=Marinomonas polaris TaxID=293552 RepID=UPI003515D528
MAIICGPIVRHTTREKINIWQVLDHEFNEINLAVYPSLQSLGNIASEVSSRVVQLGSSCFAVMLSATIAPSDSNEIIYYDVIVDGEGFVETGLNELVCLEGEKLPSVMIPKQHRYLYQASCRKPHDKQGIDHLAEIADLLKDTLGKETRPSQLYLTGDQIYADDVSPILLQSFQYVREALGLPHEMMYTDKNDFFDPDKMHLDGRWRKAKRKLGFTSGEKRSHLFSFSEYICMYLFSFGASLPQQRFAKYKALQPRLTSLRRKDDREYHYSSMQYENEKVVLERFAQTATSQVRKALANISVYMMFDDHDVTDDWNLTEENKHNLSSSWLGKQVYVNALSAYAVCQHWGNQPDAFSPTIQQNITALAKNPTQENHKPLEALFSKYWGYLLEQTPPTLVLDTRTQRVYDGDNLELMSEQQLDAIGEKLALLPKTSVLILVSPTPMYGFNAIEAAQLSPLLTKFKAFSDREPWIASEKALKNLQNALLRTPDIKHVIIFSGDVHYGFLRRQHLAAQGVTFWQFCSSAACNSPVGGNVGLSLASTMAKHFYHDDTKYLMPNGKRPHFLTSDKNIGALELDIVNMALVPAKATLHCCSASGEIYEKRYDLRLNKYREYPS